MTNGLPNPATFKRAVIARLLDRSEAETYEELEDIMHNLRAEILMVLNRKRGPP